MNLEDLLFDGLHEDEFTGLAIEDNPNVVLVGWSGRTRENKGNKRYILRCGVCAQDSELYGEGYFRTSVYNFKRGKYDCGCSVNHIHSEKQNEIIVRRKCEEGGYKFLGWVGDYRSTYHTKIRVWCEDHGEVSSQSITSCKVTKSLCRGCSAKETGKSFILPEEVRLQQCQQFCLDNRYELIGWVDGYENSHSRVKLKCPKHQREWDTAVYAVVPGKCGCIECSIEKSSISNRKPDSEMIQSFLDAGIYAEDTIFKRAEGRFWCIYCPDCGVEYKRNGGNIRNTGRGCNCADLQHYSYILNITDKGVSVGVKFGISRDVNRRLSRIRGKTCYDVEVLGIWYFQEYPRCVRAEQECKENFIVGLIPYSDMRDGYTETTYPYNLDKIVEIYERNGGVKVSQNINHEPQKLQKNV